MPASKLRSRLLLLVLLALAPTLIVCAGTTPQKEEPPPPRAPTIAHPVFPDVDKLAADQKLEEADKLLSKKIADARASHDDDTLAYALVRHTELRIALGGYETAVRDLATAAWPKSPVPSIAVELYYTHALTTYLQEYGWEIGRREKIDAPTKNGAPIVDLKAWTKDQIVTEATRHYAAMWARREQLGSWSVSQLASYITPNTYPQNVRGTLRDAIGYFAVEHLANSGQWRPDQSNDLFRVDFGKLLAGGAQPVPLDGDAHPIEKVGSILDDLEAFHTKNKRPEAALEARLERFRRLWIAFTDPPQKKALRAALADRLAHDHAHPWSTMGAYLAASWANEQGEPVRARDLARDAHAAFPTSTGGLLCRQLVAELEAPTYSMTAMGTDALGKPSITVSARNVDQIYFRAYALDLRKRVEESKDYFMLFNATEISAVMKHPPVAEWSTKLPATPDLRVHATHVTPALKKKGFYAIVSSVREDFATTHNSVLAVQIAESDLVVTSRSYDGSLEATVLDGPTGKLVEGANVELWMHDWQSGHHRIDQKRTDKSGVVRFTSGVGRSVFVIAERGPDLTVEANGEYMRPSTTDSEHTGSLVFTDRSVYRPGQTIAWKAIAYRGRGSTGRYQVEANRAFTVSLRDANYQEVQKVDVKSNAYGSANGAFTIPTGRLLGAWQIVTSLQGSQQLRVEEYKRPTFEVSMKEPKEPLHLNQPATLTGEARYYFGLPVTSGQVRYRVMREPVYPYWWWWYHGGSAASTQTIARGVSKLGADGSFDVKFLPETSANADAHVTFRYSIAADVTDDGGETRSAERSYRLGVSSVEASLSTSTGFVAANHASEIALSRTDLNGAPRAGTGHFTITRLESPERTLLPAELPVLVAERGTDSVDPTITPGDRVHARQDASYDPTQIVSSWKEGAASGAGDVTVDATGAGTIKLPALPAGAYRVRYETKDDQGHPTDALVNVIVASSERGAALKLPALLAIEHGQVAVGDTMRLLVESGLSDQTVLLYTFRAGELVGRRVLGGGSQIIEQTMTEADRGGLSFSLVVERDHQLVQQASSVAVPWDNQQLKLSFATFRDTLRPGAKETFRVSVSTMGKNPSHLAAGAAELLAYMYDRSLDVFAPHNPPSPMGLFPSRAYGTQLRSTLGAASVQYLYATDLGRIPGANPPTPDRFLFTGSYGIGGMGVRGYGFGGGGRSRAMPMAKAASPVVPPSPPAADAAMGAVAEDRTADKKEAEKPVAQRSTVAKKSGAIEAPKEEVRSNFAETAFWQPTLITDGKGEASFEFTVPDSVTSWNVWVHAITKDLRSGSIAQQTRSVKDLLVRPYLPRFLREGDEAELKVVVNNAGTTPLDGNLDFDIIDPETKASRMSLFGGKPEQRAVHVDGGKSQSFSFPVKAPRGVGVYAILAKASAKAGKDSFSDGELRPVPLLPSRLHLTQSRFVTLRDTDKRSMTFADLGKNDDPSRSNEGMVVTLDAQLFYTVLRALPYLIDYPYECAEQTLNRFVSTGIVSSLFKQYPSIAKMADKMSTRKTQLAAWDAGDANRKMGLEEAPFLFEAKGGHGPEDDVGLVNVLDQRIALANRDSALEKLGKMQTSLGAWPWFPGGPPSPYMTLYVLYGFAKAAEFNVDVPKPMVQRGWQYLARHFREEYAHRMMKDDCCWEFLALLNYVASSYPDATWTQNALTMDERKQILDFTFRHWRDHAPYMKGLLALTLKRMGRAADGKKVFDSVMDSAKTAQDQGTFWQPEDRSWLWYNDTIESHAFALRVLMELDPRNPKKDGLVLWLLLNKKLNQWKSTRATAEVIYSLAKYMQADQSLGVREAATVNIGTREQTYTFEPDQYVGKVQMIVPADEVSPKNATVTVEKKTKGVMFASTTWSFATDKLPTEASGDFFTVQRRYFLRENNGHEFIRTPLEAGHPIKVGDEIEVELAISAKHEAEYVHLRDPRGAGFEPSSVTSSYKYDLGLGYYEEVRDSGANFFFERLPAGQYTFKYRIRATTAGTFRIGPATLQSMYAPEFNAYSTGQALKIAAP